MKIKTRHIVIAVVLLALSAGVMRALSNRRAQQQLAATTSTAQTQIEIANSDVVLAQERSLIQTLGISGTVKALSVYALNESI